MSIVQKSVLSPLSSECAHIMFDYNFDKKQQYSVLIALRVRKFSGVGTSLTAVWKMYI